MKTLEFIGVLLTLAFSGVAAAGEKVLALKDCRDFGYKPKSIVVTCADAGARLNHLKWQRWNGRKASGKGDMRANDCRPSCADGSFQRYKAEVELSRVRDCGGIQYFDKITVHFPGKGPGGGNWSLRFFCP